MEFEFIKNIYENDLDILEEENENKDNNKKEIKKIDVNKYVIPKKTDNIEKIYELLSLLFISKKSSHLNFLFFSGALVKKYVDIFIYNLEALILIKDIIEIIQKNNFKFEFKYNHCDISTIVHFTGIELVKKGKIKNNELLNFITNDIYFITYVYNNSI